MREKHGDDQIHLFAKFNMGECGVYLQLKKSKDPGMPKSVELRRDRFLEWMGRPSPTFSPHASDNEAGDDEGSDVYYVGVHDGKIISALLGLGSGEGGLVFGGGDDDGGAEC